MENSAFEENAMSIRKLSWIIAVLMIFTCGVVAQDQTQAQPEKVIKHVPAKSTSAASGQQMYRSYCAACHGTDGKGGGPAASALKVPPADLTMLSKSNGGKYPSAKVATAIREGNVSAHGSKDMPVWGSLFLGMSHGHEGEVQQRIANLNKYVESLQAK
jgi:mono/diheme cytochrome c family protein